MLHAIDWLLSFCWWKPILKIFALPTQGLNPGLKSSGLCSTTRPLSCLMVGFILCVIDFIVCWFPADEGLSLWFRSSIDISGGLLQLSDDKRHEKLKIHYLPKVWRHQPKSHWTLCQREGLDRRFVGNADDKRTEHVGLLPKWLEINSSTICVLM